MTHQKFPWEKFVDTAPSTVRPRWWEWFTELDYDTRETKYLTEQSLAELAKQCDVVREVLLTSTNTVREMNENLQRARQFLIDAMDEAIRKQRSTDKAQRVANIKNNPDIVASYRNMIRARKLRNNA